VNFVRESGSEEPNWEMKAHMEYNMEMNIKQIGCEEVRMSVYSFAPVWALPNMVIKCLVA
jgi:hypothetical protein